MAGLILLVLVFPLYLARRDRDRRRMQQLAAADEAAERAARASALDFLLRGDEEERSGDGPTNAPLS
jgi:hypothetical protein